MKSDNTTQASFGEVEIEPYKGSHHNCDRSVKVSGSEIETCNFTASIRITKSGETKYYCEIHAREAWLERAGLR